MQWIQLNPLNPSKAECFLRLVPEEEVRDLKHRKDGMGCRGSGGGGAVCG